MQALPWWLKISGALLVSGAVGSLIAALTGRDSAAQHVSNFALLLTLAAVLAYVYYTYLLARREWIPSAKFGLVPYPQDQYTFAFILENHSKVSLNCWCRLNPTVCGKPVDMEGFYGGKSSFDLQPFGTANGWFAVRDILAKAGLTLAEAEGKVAEFGAKGVLYLNIEFWYTEMGSAEKVRNPKQPHFFDFARGRMVADF